MSWNQLILDVPDYLKDAVIGEISDDGIVGVWETDAPETGLTRLILYLESRSNIEDIENRVQMIFERERLANPAILKSFLNECDWTEEWKKSYTSFPVGDDFYVIPSWANCECPDDRLPIRIDPGQAFGTGTHETTQMTIEALERWVEPDHVVLDVGTGSGILAIASRLLGARRVFACDIDAVATQVALANIQRNSETDVWTFCGSVDAVGAGAVRVVMCNLTAELITSLFSEIDRVLEPGGIAIFSGILHEQIEEMSQVFEKFHYTVHEELTRGEWMSVITEKYGA